MKWAKNIKRWKLPGEWNLIGLKVSMSLNQDWQGSNKLSKLFPIAYSTRLTYVDSLEFLWFNTACEQIANQ